MGKKEQRNITNTSSKYGNILVVKEVIFLCSFLPIYVISLPALFNYLKYIHIYIYIYIYDGKFSYFPSPNIFNHPPTFSLRNHLKQCIWHVYTHMHIYVTYVNVHNLNNNLSFLLLACL